MMIDLRPIGCVQAPLAGQQGSCSVRNGTRLAQRRASFCTGDASTAARHEHQHHPIAGFEIGHAGPAFHDLTGGFMPERHGHRTGTIAADDRKIRMAQARSAHAQQDFAMLGRIEFDLGNAKGFALSVRSGKADSLENGSANFHLKLSRLLGGRRRN